MTGKVTADTAGSYTNTLAADALQTDQGNNAAPASATLEVTTGVPPVAAVTPTALDFTLATDETADQTLNIANAAGTDPLTFSIAARSPDNVRFNLRPTDRQMKRAAMFYAKHPPSLAASGTSDGGGAAISAPWMPPATASGDPLVFMYDDSSVANALGLGLQSPSASESMAVFIDRFAPPAGTGAYTIDTISILWPTPDVAGGDLTGLQPNLVVYYDADADGDPSNAIRLGADTLVTIAAQGVFEDYPVSFNVPGDGDVYVGFADQWAAAGGHTPRLFPAGIDEGASQGMSYLSGASTAITDLTHLANNDLTGTIDSFDLPGNFMIRAVGNMSGGASCSGPIVSWLTAAPASGSVDGGANTDITVTANPAAGSLAAGSYSAELCITTNDPTQSLIAVPVTLTVTVPDAIFCGGFEVGDDGSCRQSSGGGHVVDSGAVDIAVPMTGTGLYINWLTGCTGSSSSDCTGGSDFDPYASDGALAYFWPDAAGLCVAAGGFCDTMSSGDTISSASTFATGDPDSTVLAGGTYFIGFSFMNDDTGVTNYGYVKVTSTAPSGFPFTINEYWYDNTGAAISIP